MSLVLAKIPPIVDPSRKGTGGRRDLKKTSEPGRPERLSASVRKLQSIVGRSPDLKNCRFDYANRSKQKPHHSGATARDSHPFPYSPHLLGHPDAFKYKEQLSIEADVITRARTVSNSPCTPARDVASGALLRQLHSSKIQRTFKSEETTSTNDQNHRMDR